jgi:hypothetical protein
MALSFSFTGGFSLTDTNASAITETLSLTTAAISPLGIDPAGDGLAVGGTMTIGALTLVDSAPVGSVFPFTGTAPLAIFDAGAGGEQLTATITPISMVTIANAGTIDAGFVGNISGIAAGSAYVPGNSAIIDYMLTLGTASSATITLQIAPLLDLEARIKAGTTSEGTYSGSLAVIPVPSSIAMLLSTFAVGAVVVCGRRLRK